MPSKQKETKWDALTKPKVKMANRVKTTSSSRGYASVEYNLHLNGSYY